MILAETQDFGFLGRFIFLIFSIPKFVLNEIHCASFVGYNGRACKSSAHYIDCGKSSIEEPSLFWIFGFLGLKKFDFPMKSRTRRVLFF